MQLPNTGNTNNINNDYRPMAMDLDLVRKSDWNS